MKHFTLFIFLAAGIVSAGFAQEMKTKVTVRDKSMPGFDQSYLKEENRAISEALGDKKFGEMTLNELKPYQERLRLASRKDLFVSQSGAMSFMIPGAGQFHNGDALGGTLFLLLDLATIAGSLTGAYFLLPADLRFDRIDYFNTPISTIRASWEGKTIVDFLPSFGVMAGGALVNLGVRMLASHNARETAKAAIDSGAVKFDLDVTPGILGLKITM